MNNNKLFGQNSDVISRRQFLQSVGVGSLGIMAGGFLPLLNPSAKAANQNKLAGTGFIPDLDIELKAIAGEVPILPGNPSSAWQYKAKVHKGDSNRLIELPRSYLGPIIKVNL